MVRLGYWMVGLLMGVIYTCDASSRVIHIIDREWAAMVSTYTLVGYHEGWQRGRDYTEAKWGYINRSCYQQNEKMQEYIQHLHKKLKH